MASTHQKRHTFSVRPSASLTDFGAFLKFSSDNDIGERLDSIDDLRFFLPDGTPVAWKNVSLSLSGTSPSRVLDGVCRFVGDFPSSSDHQIDVRYGGTPIAAGGPSSTLSIGGSPKCCYDLNTISPSPVAWAGSNYSTTVASAPTNASTPYGGVTVFDAIDDAISIGTVAVNWSLPFSICVRFYNGAFYEDYPCMFSIKTDGANSFVVCLSNQTAYQGLLFGSADSVQRHNDVPGTTYNVTWVDAVITYNGNGKTTASNFKAYLDGTLQTMATAGAFAGSTNATKIGGVGLGWDFYRWKGRVADVQIFGSELSAAHAAYRTAHWDSPGTWGAEVEINHNLDPTSLEHVTVIDSAIVNNDMAASDLAHESSIGNAVSSQDHAFATDGELDHATVTDDATMGVLYHMDAGGLSHDTVIDETSCGTTLAFQPQDIDHDTGIDEAEITEDHLLSCSSLSHEVTISDVGFTQDHAVTGSGLSHSVIIDDTTAGLVYLLVAGGISHLTGIEPSSLSQFHKLTGRGIATDMALSYAVIDGKEGSVTTAMQYEFETIRRLLGRELGLPPVAEWNEEESQEIADVMQEAQSMYYFPLPTEPGAQPHEWSFLRPTYTLETVAGEREYTLPDGFERFVGNLVYTGENGGEIVHIPLGRLNELSTGEVPTTRPTKFAVQAVAGEGGDSQQQKLILYPTPSDVHYATGEYLACPYLIDEEHPVPLGGPVHGYGILLACYAIGERRYDNSDGARMQEFLMHLKTMVTADGRRKPSIVGSKYERPGFKNAKAYRRAYGVFGSPTFTHPWGD